jgi:decaprenyl-phosphate phosphoribosyltransferase
MKSFQQQLWSLFIECRPTQWLKNLLCLSALLIEPNIGGGDIARALLIAVSFVLASSSIYILNDIVDAKSDRLHPKKKNRPIAAGLLNIKVASASSICFLAASMIISSSISVSALFTVIAYVALQIFYSLRGKKIPLVDVYCIALGFILRALAGVFAIKSEPSPWFLIAAGCLSLYLAVEKRRSEISRVISESEDSNSRPVFQRKVLAFYDLASLDRIGGLLTSSGFMSYTLWASGPKLGGSTSSAMLLTCPLVLFGITRYQLLMKNGPQALGESPTQVLRSDKPIQAILIAWSLMTFFLQRV